MVITNYKMNRTMKHKYFLQYVVLILCAILSMTSCSSKDYGSPMDEAKLIKSIKLNVSDPLKLALGMKKQIQATITPDTVLYPKLSWVSSNGNIASVSQDGTVSASTLGQAIITISQVYNLLSLKQINVNVMPVATSIALNPISMYEGTTKPSNIVIEPSSAYNIFNWSSSDTSIVKVDSAGNITGKKPGQIQLTAKSVDGSNLTAQTTVTVNKVIPIEKMQLYAPGYDMMIGDKALVKCNLTPSDATSDLLTWVSSDNKIATVDNNGLITAVGAGTATITASDPRSDISESVNVTVVANGVVSLTLSNIKSLSDLNSYGWGIGQNPSSVNFGGTGMTVAMSIQSNSKYRADMMMANSAHPVVLNIGTYRYFAIEMDTPGNGSLKLDTSSGDYGNAPTGKLQGLHPIIYWDLQTRTYFPTNGLSGSLTTFQVKIADVNLAPYYYKVYWVRTFKTLDDLKTYVTNEQQ
jgi:uncharacterized protein YjdB